MNVFDLLKMTVCFLPLPLKPTVLKSEKSTTICFLIFFTYGRDGKTISDGRTRDFLPILANLSSCFHQFIIDGGDGFKTDSTTTNA